MIYKVTRKRGNDVMGQMGNLKVSGIAIVLFAASVAVGMPLTSLALVVVFLLAMSVSGTGFGNAAAAPIAPRHDRTVTSAPPTTSRQFR